MLPRTIHNLVALKAFSNSGQQKFGHVQNRTYMIPERTPNRRTSESECTESENSKIVGELGGFKQNNITSYGQPVSIVYRHKSIVINCDQLSYYYKNMLLNNAFT